MKRAEKCKEEAYPELVGSSVLCLKLLQRTKLTVARARWQENFQKLQQRLKCEAYWWHYRRQLQGFGVRAWSLSFPFVNGDGAAVWTCAIATKLEQSVGADALRDNALPSDAFADVCFSSRGKVGAQFVDGRVVKALANASPAAFPDAAQL